MAIDFACQTTLRWPTTRLSTVAFGRRAKHTLHGMQISTENKYSFQIDITPPYPYDGLYLYGHFVNGTQLSATRARNLKKKTILVLRSKLPLEFAFRSHPNALDFVPKLERPARSLLRTMVLLFDFDSLGMKACKLLPTSAFSCALRISLPTIFTATLAQIMCLAARWSR